MYLIKETGDRMTKIIKSILGTKAKYSPNPKGLNGEWYKRGGYADSTFSKTRDKLENLGFKKVKGENSMTQFEVATNESIYQLTDPEFVIEVCMSSSFGAESSSNRHNIKAKGVRA
jgi:hypothetical protein